MAAADVPRPRARKEYRLRVDPFSYSDAKFVKRFRLDKATVRDVLTPLFVPYCSTAGTEAGGGLPFEHRVCLALRYFATGSNYTTVGDSAGVSASTVSRCVHDLARCLYGERDQFIQFPNNLQRQTAAAARFYELFNKPRLVGAIDGVHFPILRPHDEENEGGYVNRNGYHSLNAIMVCNGDMQITYCNATWPGSVNDSMAFGQSELADYVEENGLGDFFMLGDSGFPAMNGLFIPYEGRNVTVAQQAYNVWHRHTRCIIERCFGILKMRWRCISDSAGYLPHTPEWAAKIVTSCAVLHNVAMARGIPLPEDDEDDEQQNHPPMPQPDQQPGPVLNRNLQEEFVAQNF